jgi:hypothetical protein
MPGHDAHFRGARRRYLQRAVLATPQRLLHANDEQSKSIERFGRVT